MDYKEKYEQALENMRKFRDALNNHEILDLSVPRKEIVTDIEYYFPELKEDEDELEWLKQFIQEEAYSLSLDIRDDEDQFRLKMLKRSLEWLEKQGESIKIKKGKNYLCTKTHKYAGVEWIEGVKYYSPEDYSLINQGCTCYCPKYSKEEHNNFFKEAEYDGCLEKQGEQKLIIDGILTATNYDKMFQNCNVHKFNAGDWVVDSLVGRVKQVQSIDNYGYNFNNGDFTSFDSANENYHLWTIQDARDGNVLVDDCGNVLIYQEPSTDGYCHSYCYCNEMAFIGQGGSHGIEHSHPATQRQRELLFQKMDEAHYEWDAEKKELKKIGGISNTCEAVESESEMAKAALFFIENCRDYFACNGVAKIDVINWFKETFYGK